MCEPSLPTRPGSFASALQRGLAPRALVDLDDRGVVGLLLVGDRDGHDLLGHAPVVDRLQRQLVRAQRPAVEVRAGHLQLVADLGGLDEHLLARERVGEPVVDHRVEDLGVAHAVAEAALGHQVGGLGHRLHAAAHADLHIAGADRLVEQHARPQPRRADLVDRLRGDLLGDARLDLGLARGDLALARLQHLADDHVIDLLGLHLGALERRRDRQSAELGGGQRREPAAHLADRGAGRAEDHGVGHESSGLLEVVACAGCGDGSGRLCPPPAAEPSRAADRPRPRRDIVPATDAREHDRHPACRRRRRHDRRRGLRRRPRPRRAHPPRWASCWTRARPGARSGRWRSPTPTAGAG